MPPSSVSSTAHPDSDSSSTSLTASALQTVRTAVAVPESELKRWRRTFDTNAKLINGERWVGFTVSRSHGKRRDIAVYFSSRLLTWSYFVGFWTLKASLMLLLLPGTYQKLDVPNSPFSFESQIPHGEDWYLGMTLLCLKPSWSGPMQTTGWLSSILMCELSWSRRSGI